MDIIRPMFKIVEWMVTVLNDREMMRLSTSVCALLFDYRKAFDLIDHKILVNKLKQVNIPYSVIH